MDFPFYDAPNTAAIICCHIIDDVDPSVGDLKDMPCGYCAERKTENDNWIVKKR